MKALIFLMVLMASSSAVAQTKPAPRSVAARVDKCAPIGRTEDGKLVYSMKCDNLPVAPSPAPQAETRDAAPAEPEVRRTGIFGLSREYKRPDE